MASAVVASGDLPITVKCAFDGDPRRFKISLRDVAAANLENKLREILAISENTVAVFERYSDSAGSYITLDPSNVSVYKQLYRAAKAKQKLKLRVTTAAKVPKPVTVEDEPEVPAPPKPAEDNKTEQPLISLSPPSLPFRDSERDLDEALDRLESTLSLNEATEAFKRQHEKITRNLDMLEASVNAFSNMNNQRFSSRGFMEREYVGHSSLSEGIPPSVRSFPTLGARCPALGSTYAVCCNACDKTIPGAHYHCSTCDDGDFDLCQECVDQGETCKGSDHWLIKRSVKDGAFINSTTERIAPKSKAPKPEIPGPREELPAEAAKPERVVPVLQKFLYQNIRTCNCCVGELPESEFVHCNDCEDFDLCKNCFTENKHGHHPKHAFSAAVNGAVLEPEVQRRLAPGRNHTHYAICDGCDKTIRGVRHKCLDCPDWDYCNECIVDAGFVHADHRFVPVYEPIESTDRMNARAISRAYHFGICCDGPLCQGRGNIYIVGERYKCAVCHDTDFCASCEASPANTHNKTHPLIKFKTPVKYVSITTSGAQGDGKRMPIMGDQDVPSRSSCSSTRTSSRATETAESTVPFVRSNVCTVADVKPTTSPVAPPAPQPKATVDDLIAVYSRETVTDGTVLPTDHLFSQTWFLRNEGTVSWPAGCAVRFVGGDYMGRVNPNRPAGVGELANALQSLAYPEEVAPGQEIPFTVWLRTPTREGKAISYWRLTTQDGMKFGHRLWCDINVKALKVEEEVKEERAWEVPIKEEPAEKDAEAEPVQKEIKEEPAEKDAEAEPVQREIKEKPAVDDIMEESVPEKSSAPLPAEAEESFDSEKTVEQSLEKTMIFPKLETESPLASIHQETTSEAEAPPAYEEEYAEVDEWSGEWTDPDSFLTDDEYDVLDASDEEFQEDQQKKLLGK